MKKYLFFGLLLLLGASYALADLPEDFRVIYHEKGIDAAVVDALSEGYSPDQIVKTALPIEGLSREVLIKALYCALVPPVFINEAAKGNGITEQTVIEGYELALVQCAEGMEETENAAPAQFTGNSSSSGGRTINASPSTF